MKPYAEPLGMLIGGGIGSQLKGFQICTVLMLQICLDIL